MVNLVITILSIALVAIAAVMAVWYGGSSFMNQQAKADANTMIQNMQQMAAAIQLYATQQNGGNVSFPVTIDGTTASIGTYLMPTYIQEMPYLPIYKATTDGGTSFIYPGGWTVGILDSTGQWNVSGSPTAGTAIQAIGLRLDYSTRAYNACIQLVQQLYGPSATPTPRSNPSYVKMNLSRQIDCGYLDANSNGVLDNDGAEDISILYHFN